MMGMVCVVVETKCSQKLTLSPTDQRLCYSVIGKYLI